MAIKEFKIYKKIIAVFGSEIILLVSRMILVLYVANYMGVDSVGIYTTLMTWASILSLFALFGGYNIIQKEGATEKIVSIILCLSFFLSILSSFTITAIFFGDILSIAFPIVVSEAVGLAVKSVAKSVCYSIDKVSVLAKVNVYNSVCYIIGVCIIFMLDSVKMLELSVFIVLYNFSTAILYGILILKNVGFVSFKIGDCIDYMRNSYAYLISSSLRNLFIQIDKVIVNFAFGNTVSGVYNLCSRFVTTAVLPANIYIQTIESKFYKGEGEEALDLLRRSKKYVVIISLSLSILSVPFVFVLSKYLSGLNGVFEAYIYFIPLAVSFNLAYVYLSYLNAADNTLRILSLTVLISFVCLSIFFVKALYPASAILVPLISSFVIFLSLVFIHEKIKKKSIIKVDR